MSYTLIERKELTSTASTVSFDNVPDFYTDLIVLLSPRLTSSTELGINLFFNGVTTGISYRKLFGRGSSVGSGTADGPIILNGPTWTANTFGNVSIYIPNYRSLSQKNFSIDGVIETNDTLAYQTISAGLWTGTSSITSFQLSTIDSTFTAGSSFSLYGINRQQAIGKPKAIGGAISFVNGYWVHSFTGSGTFYAQEDIECQYLVVAGGGGAGGLQTNYGGGNWGGGAGGAGGYRSSVTGELSGGGASAESRFLATANSSHVVAVGAGGAAGFSSGTPINGTQGSSSTFSNIVSIGGGYGGYANLSSSGPSAGANGGPGGSGGGGGDAHVTPVATGGSGTAGQGFAGGAGTYDAGAGSGGGAGSAGSGTSPFNGGSGLTSTITGSSVTRAAGAKGGKFNSAGGLPTVNTGNGGNIPTVVNGQPFAGASGIVIIRYKA